MTGSTKPWAALHTDDRHLRGRDILACCTLGVVLGIVLGFLVAAQLIKAEGVRLPLLETVTFWTWVPLMTIALAICLAIVAASERLPRRVGLALWIVSPGTVCFVGVFMLVISVWAAAG